MAADDETVEVTTEELRLMDGVVDEARKVVGDPSVSHDALREAVERYGRYLGSEVRKQA